MPFRSLQEQAAALLEMAQDARANGKIELADLLTEGAFRALDRIKQIEAEQQQPPQQQPQQQQQSNSNQSNSNHSSSNSNRQSKRMTKPPCELIASRPAAGAWGLHKSRSALNRAAVIIQPDFLGV